MLVASADVPGRTDLRQTVSISRAADGGARVDVEHFPPFDWDLTLEQFEQHFPDFEAALNWLETQCSIHWSQLHEIGRPPPSLR